MEDATGLQKRCSRQSGYLHSQHATRMIEVDFESSLAIILFRTTNMRKYKCTWHNGGIVERRFGQRNSIYVSDGNMVVDKGRDDCTLCQISLIYFLLNAKYIPNNGTFILGMLDNWYLSYELLRLEIKRCNVRNWFTLTTFVFFFNFVLCRVSVRQE